MTFPLHATLKVTCLFWLTARVKPDVQACSDDASIKHMHSIVVLVHYCVLGTGFESDPCSYHCTCHLIKIDSVYVLCVRLLECWLLLRRILAWTAKPGRLFRSTSKPKEVLREPHTTRPGQKHFVTS